MPEHDFDEVVTRIPFMLKMVYVPDIRVMSDLVRLYEAIERPGWAYHDFDCTVHSWPQMDERAWFARFGLHQIDHFLFYVGQPKVFHDLLMWVLVRSYRRGRFDMAYSEVHHVLNQKLLNRVGVIEAEHFTHESERVAA